MINLLNKYSEKLVAAGVAEAPLLGGLDAELVWNREDPATEVLERVFDNISINSLLFAEPAEPFRSIINFLASNSDGAIFPADCETRTFLHDLPVQSSFSHTEIVEALKQRKSVIIPGSGIVTFGTVSPEQAFVSYSSVCFATFVKFFSNCLSKAKRRELGAEEKEILANAIEKLPELPTSPPALACGPFIDEEQIYSAIAEAGRYTVDYKLVDSFFGNVSYRMGETLYISQTGASLDEMEGCIDPCRLDGGSCAAVTASSELTAHREVVTRTDNTAILHGHPKFSVILSMECEKERCPERGKCHINCKEERFLKDIPVVPGEVGTGPRGLCNTLPRAMEGNRGVIVYGHGLFTVGKDDFNDAFATLVDVEQWCREEYVRQIGL